MQLSKLNKEETTMATKKSVCVLFAILVILAWVLGSTIQAGAETMKFRNVQTATKDETIPVGDEEGHVLGLQIGEGLALIENGEIAKMRSHNVYDFIPGKGAQNIGYAIYRFEDGSTIVQRFQRLLVVDKSGNISAQTTGELIKGTGRFEGIKGTASATGKTFPPGKGEAFIHYNDITFTYTLPPK